MNNSLKRFIEKNIELIETNNIEELYQLAGAQSVDNISALGAILRSIGIYPLNELDRVPNWYRYNDQFIQGESIPDHVKAIGSNAYDRCTNLKRINLGKVTFIANYAFMNSGLEQVTIPGSCQQISMAAFASCKSLRKVIIEEGVEIISRRAFTFSSIEEITLPSSITFLGDSNFAPSTKLLLPRNNTAIERYLESHPTQVFEYIS